MSDSLNTAVVKAIDLVEEKLFTEHKIALHPDHLLSLRNKLLNHEQFVVELQYASIDVYFNNSYFPTWVYLRVTNKENNSTQAYSFSLSN